MNRHNPVEPHTQRESTLHVLPEAMEAAIGQAVEERIQQFSSQSPLLPLWTVKEVASYLNVSKRTVEHLIADGEIAPIWIRGQRRFDRETIKAYAHAQVG
jgi:excisionase family DNA binding protein